MVAVKVRHPGVADTVLRDFELMLTVARLASRLPSIAHLRLEDTLKQFAAPLKEQVRVWVGGEMMGVREARSGART